MTYEEALTYLERIRDTAIGAPVKGRLIQSLSIGPTDWEQMTDFMNLQIKKGEEAAAIEFSSVMARAYRSMAYQLISNMIYLVGR